MAEKAEPTGWMGGRFLPHMLSRLPLMPSEVLLRTAAKLPARLAVTKGRVEAQVEGQTATLRVKPLGDREWKAVLEAVAEQSEAAYRMLSGQFGDEVEEAFAAAGAELFPAVSGVSDFRCSCKEPNVCRHICALLLTATVQFDENPFLWLEALGRPRAGLLAALQARLADRSGRAGSGAGETGGTGGRAGRGGTGGQAGRAGAGEAGAANRPGPAGEAEAAQTGAGEIQAERFWGTETDPAAISVRLGDTDTAPDALLRALGPLPMPSEQTWVELLVSKPSARGPAVQTRTARPLDEALQGYVRYIGEAAGALARGDLPPRYEPEALPGKAVHLADRLLPEVEAAVRAEGAVLSLEQIAAACPTTAALTAARSALPDVLAALPPDLIALAGRYAGPRSALLAGAAFRHVVTYDEQQQGRLSPDADWARALRAAGAEPPWRVRVGGSLADPLDPACFAALRLQVGDELWLTVADPVGPALVAQPVQREERQPGLDPAGAAAVNALLRHMAATGHKALPEEEAAAVLLAEGHYVRRENQDPAWLLPYQMQGIAPAPVGTGLARETGPWQPACARRPAATWAPGDRAEALRRYEADQRGQGVSHQALENALQTVRWWCSVWPGPQDRVLQVPDVGALLEFLWVTAPRHAATHGVDPAAVPGVLSAWFATLEAGSPELGGAYAEHQAACALEDAYSYRLRSLPPAGAPGEAALGWIVEGYRWLGPGRCR